MAQDPNDNAISTTSNKDTENQLVSHRRQPKQLTKMPDIAPYKQSWALYWELMDFQFCGMGRYLYEKMKKDMIYLNENKNWRLGELKWKTMDDPLHKIELKPWFFDDHYERFMELNFFENELIDKKCIYCKKNVKYFNFAPMEYAHPECQRAQWKKCGKKTF